MSMIDRWMAGIRLAGRIDEMQELALRAEHHAQTINGLAPTTPPTPGPGGVDVVEVLRTTCTLLERAPTPARTQRAGARRVTRADMPQPRPVAPQPLPVPEAARPVERVAEPAPVDRSGARGDDEPSAAIMELITVCDMVALAARGDDGSARQVLAGLDRRLGRVLEKAGVRSLDDRGRLDYLYQEIIETRPTADPDQDEVVCATVRKGYAVGDRVLRPQQVIAYRLEG